MNKKAFTINCHAEFISASHEIPKQVRNDSKRVAFTLAEVLITLTIIGVIAALTIPNLMQKWEEQHTVSAVKEAYSILSNAMKQLIRENGTLDEWSWPNDKSSSYYLAEQLQQYVKLHGICAVYDNTCYKKNGYSTSPNWHMWSGYKTLQGTQQAKPIVLNNNTSTVAKLANGMDIAISYFTGASLNSNSSHVTNIGIDINGYGKGPNRLGYDYFILPLQTNGFKVGGCYTNTALHPASCSLSNTREFSGASCAQWVLLHGNTIYQKEDVSIGTSNNCNSKWKY